MTAAVLRAERGGSSSGMARSQVKHTTKVRKPYTITKQRERWTDEEHELFLEALDKHGRAWRSIQEHIGTKTTVQIRSHAQKFFSKLEKEKRPQRAVAAHDPHATAPRQRPKPRTFASTELQSVSSSAAASAKSHSSAGHQQRSAADIAAAAGIVAAAAALQVIQSATEEVQAELQASPPQGFPFFGMAPSVLSALSATDMQMAVTSSSMSNGMRHLLATAQTSEQQAAASGSRDSLRDSVASGMQVGLPMPTAQANKCHERSSDLSECHVSLPAPAQCAQQARIGSPDSERKATGTDKAPQYHASRRALAHSPSGKGSSSLDQIIPDLRSSPADSDGNITLSAGTDTHSVGAVHSAGAVAQSVRGATNDSSQACSNVHLAQNGKATAMAQLAEAAAAICSEEKALKAQQAEGEEVLPSVQAHAYMGSTPANNCLAMFPAMPNLQQAMAAWGPYLALYQMQAMMGAPMSGPLGGGVGPLPEQVAAQQAQHAFMLAVHQMAHSQSPMALPHSLGIAIVAASQGPSGPAALVSNGSMPLPDVSRAPGLTTKPSAWLGANPFDVPLPPSSINPSWLAPQGPQGGAPPLLQASLTS